MSGVAAVWGSAGSGRPRCGHRAASVLQRYLMAVHRASVSANVLNSITTVRNGMPKVSRSPARVPREVEWYSSRMVEALRRPSIVRAIGALSSMRAGHRHQQSYLGSEPLIWAGRSCCRQEDCGHRYGRTAYDLGKVALLRTLNSLKGSVWS